MEGSTTKAEVLKKVILSQYKSVRQFAVEMDIPYSTLVTALERGIEGMAYSTVIRICDALSLNPVDFSPLDEGDGLSAQITEQDVGEHMPREAVRLIDRDCAVRDDALYRDLLVPHERDICLDALHGVSDGPPERAPEADFAVCPVVRIALRQRDGVAAACGLADQHIADRFCTARGIERDISSPDHL